MEIIDAIFQRKSIRGFRTDPVSKDRLAKVLQSACRAPSAMNTQPWEFTVLTGDVLNKVRAAVIDQLKRNEPTQSEHQVTGFLNDGIYRDRQIELDQKIFSLMDIPREDKMKRAAWLERGFRFFDAPVAVLILTDKSLGDIGPILDLGAVMQTICLAALNFGLGTCIEDQGVLYPKVLREIAQIPENKKIIIAIAIGYPDWNFPANALVSSRASIDHNTRWLGF